MHCEPNMTDGRRKSISEICAEATPILAALRRAAAEALEFHRRIGTPVPVGGVNGSVRWVDPRTIRLPDEDAPSMQH